MKTPELIVINADICTMDPLAPRVAALAVLVTIELAWKSARRYLAIAGRWPIWKRRGGNAKSAEELDLSIWQEMERDPVVREKLRALASDDGFEAVEEAWKPD